MLANAKAIANRTSVVLALTFLDSRVSSMNNGNHWAGAPEGTGLGLNHILLSQYASTTRTVSRKLRMHQGKNTYLS